MILTVTPNPSVDRTLVVDVLTRGAVLRARRSSSEPSGKGVNVALALHRHGIAAAAVVPVGGAAGAQLSAMLRDAGLAVHPVPVAGEVRANISLVEPDGTVTKVNEPGPRLTPAEVDDLVATVADHLDGVSWLVCAGSLPPGAPSDLYAHLGELGRSRGVRVAVDTSGEPLARALPAGPNLVKPNVQELTELVGRPLRTLGDVLDAAGEVRSRGPRAVLVSLGADGAVLVGPGGTVHAEARAVKVASAVGAGDAALAGFLGAGGDGAGALRAAVAWGATAVAHAGTLFPAVDPGQAVTVHASCERARVLRDTGPPGPAERFDRHGAATRGI